MTIAYMLQMIINVVHPTLHYLLYCTANRAFEIVKIPTIMGCELVDQSVLSIRTAAGTLASSIFRNDRCVSSKISLLRW